MEPVSNGGKKAKRSFTVSTGDPVIPSAVKSAPPTFEDHNAAIVREQEIAGDVGLTHIFDVNGYAPLDRPDRRPMVARCGLNVATADKISYAVFVAGHSSCCPKCASAPVEKRAFAIALKVVKK